MSGNQFSNGGFGGAGSGFGTGGGYGSGGGFGSGSGGQGSGGGFGNNSGLGNNSGFGTGSGPDAGKGAGGSFGSGGRFGQGGGQYGGGSSGTGMPGGVSGGKTVDQDKYKLYAPALIASIIYGILWIFPGELIVSRLINRMWNPLAVAIYATAFVLPLILLLIFMSRAAGNLDITLRMWGKGKTIGLIALCLAGTFLASMLMEYLYELSGNIRYYKPTSYVFVIDDSKSMETNDPDTIRAQAIGEIMREEDIPYCVYRFSEDAVSVSGMKPYEDSDTYTFSSDGESTDILRSLATVYNEMMDPGFGGGARPKILLLSDGVSDPTYLEEVVKIYTDQHISISTVGFGSADEELMKKIADQSGGAFVKCSNLASLSRDMHEAILSSSSNTLLTPRYNERNKARSSILRVILLTMIAAMIGLTKGRGAVSDADFLRLFVFTAGQGLIAAIVFELLVNSHPRHARFILNILWAAAFMTHRIVDFSSGSGIRGKTDGFGQDAKRRRQVQAVGNRGKGPRDNPRDSGNTGWGNPGGSGNTGWGNPGGSGNTGWGNPDGSGNTGWGNPGGSGNTGWGNPDGSGNTGWGNPDGSGNTGWGNPGGGF